MVEPLPNLPESDSDTVEVNYPNVPPLKVPKLILAAGLISSFWGLVCLIFLRGDNGLSWLFASIAVLGLILCGLYFYWNARDAREPDKLTHSPGAWYPYVLVASLLIPFLSYIYFFKLR
ncbi:hypothetical protein KIH39_06565 [Telmatocola sphagniphila]|uniref:Uncharacterized protein n=1 Tax=Telmatocola sphagniphila TaxID=1123043 RepID=A0A8E6B7J7_9BACT|nr:hypothetical protein [Telmatocola sphagniphila]QVL33570.1 hypothetical protein KIH39_06565 [Telmatocola sphagniphila]